MDTEFRNQSDRTLFVWDMEKASENESKHEIEFTEAATVFDDPMLIITEASRNGEHRDKAIGFSCTGKLLSVIHTEPVDAEFIRIISAWRATTTESTLYIERP